MTWSLQLTIWALPPLLGVLVVLRDFEYLWPRRRETGAGTLLAASVSAGAWAILMLLSILTPNTELATALELFEYVPAALTPVLWVVFALAFAHRPRDLKRWPALLLYGLTLVTVGLVARGDPQGLLIRSVALVDLGETVGLSIDPGWWHWVHVGVRATAVAGAGLVLGRQQARSNAPGAIAWVVLGCVLALGPSVVPFTAVPGAGWADQSAAGFALGTSVFGLGLMRRRLLDLGPVARTLVMDELRGPILVLDGRGHIVDANRAADETLGIRPYGDVPLPLGTLWASSRKEVVRTATIELEVVGGESRTFEVTVSRMGRGGGHGHTALLLLDITDRERMRRDLEASETALRKANANLKHLANTDELTGLSNRRHFMEELEREIERAHRYDRPLSLVLMDLDHFKSVNDTHGHAAGDQVLRAAAVSLRSVGRDVDIAARIGGEELALLLPETTQAGALTVAERMRERIEAEWHRAPSGAAFRITGSIGVASLGRGAATGEALLQAADEALYRAKAEGRNRVVEAD